jgi:septum formation protein
MTPLVLASQSPYRRAQLESFGLKFITDKPLVDEEALKTQGPKDLAELTRFLSSKKALSLKLKYPNAVILGSDQLTDFHGERLDKPGSHERAFEQLKKMSGQEHRLITSLSVLFGETTLNYTDVTRIRLKTLDPDLITAYLKADQPYDCAGAYKIERAGLCLVESIESKDPSAIQGLPMMSLMRAFDSLGINLTDHWK